MKITVLGGSPKGNDSVTMQYVKYLQKQFPQHEFEIVQVAGPIKRLENDEKEFRAVIEQVKSSDGVLWAFPLYVFLVCSQYKRFIELIWERDAAEAFHGKYAASLSTSIHFFDNTAHNYIHAISDDLGMSYMGAFSAQMQDLLKPEGQRKLMLFARGFFDTIENRIEIAKSYNPLRRQDFKYNPSGDIQRKISTDKRVVVVTDSCTGNVGAMIERFKENIESSVEIVNLHGVDIKGGCLGCLQCGPNNVCSYAGKDGFIDMYNDKLKTADILVFAGSIKDRYLSSKWKQFFDRSFFNTHQRSLTGKQIAFLISGPLSEVQNLREILKAYVEWQHSNLVGFVSDEGEKHVSIDRAIDGLASRLVRNAEEEYIQPVTFLGIGGMKIFRDDIWGALRFVFRADHKNYKKTGVYDFPQRKPLRNIFIRLVSLITAIPWIRRKMMGNFRKFMLMPYRRLLKSA
jgi:multimeric flavodoxin WrbA